VTTYQAIQQLRTCPDFLSVKSSEMSLLRGALLWTTAAKVDVMLIKLDFIHEPTRGWQWN